MDREYANKQIDLIVLTADELRNLYYSKERDANKIRECYETLMKQIGDYMDYLHKVNVPFNESYISNWVEEDRNVWLFDDVEYYLDTV